MMFESMIDTIGITLAQTGGGEAAADVSPALQVQSVWDFVVKGGIMMIPIGLCSLVALMLVTERIISLRRSRIIPRGLVPALKKVMKDESLNTKKLQTACKKFPSPAANVMSAAIRRLNMPLEVIERHIEETGAREQLKMRRFLRWLSVIAAVSPLLGLLGTIFGMIQAFQTVAVSGEALGRAEMLATGIYQAMITTAAGLVVAIPALICYHFIAARVDKLVMDIDTMAADFIEDVIDIRGAEAVGDDYAEAASNGATAEIHR
ncbi:MAG: MotA/TolQ/ExbB proton channel family protein [Planctomycetota bacterium]